MAESAPLPVMGEHPSLEGGSAMIGVMGSLNMFEMSDLKGLAVNLPSKSGGEPLVQQGQRLPRTFPRPAAAPVETGAPWDWWGRKQGAQESVKPEPIAHRIN